jgi:hypothetical protein
MSIVEYHGLVLPSSPNDQKRLKDSLNEMVNSLAKIKAEQEHKGDIATHILEEFGIPKKLVNKAATAIFNETYQQIAAESQDLETLIEYIRPSSDNS